jgi:hypothetical protein
MYIGLLLCKARFPPLFLFSCLPAEGENETREASATFQL